MSSSSLQPGSLGEGSRGHQEPELKREPPSEGDRTSSPTKHPLHTRTSRQLKGGGFTSCGPCWLPLNSHSSFCLTNKTEKYSRKASLLPKPLGMFNNYSQLIMVISSFCDKVGLGLTMKTMYDPKNFRGSQLEALEKYSFPNKA